LQASLLSQAVEAPLVSNATPIKNDHDIPTCNMPEPPENPELLEERRKPLSFKTGPF
jgi:hypothetical protein